MTRFPIVDLYFTYWDEQPKLCHEVHGLADDEIEVLLEAMQCRFDKSEPDTFKFSMKASDDYSTLERVKRRRGGEWRDWGSEGIDQRLMAALDTHTTDGLTDEQRRWLDVHNTARAMSGEINRLRVELNCHEPVKSSVLVAISREELLAHLDGIEYTPAKLPAINTALKAGADPPKDGEPLSRGADALPEAQTPAGLLQDEELTALCGLSPDEADMPAEAMAALRSAERLIHQNKHLTLHDETLACAAVLVTAALGHLRRYRLVSLPFGYSGPRVAHDGWVRREDVERVWTQLAGLLHPAQTGQHLALTAEQAAGQACELNLVEPKDYDAWEPGMPSGSGWCKVLKPTVFGLAKARRTAAPTDDEDTTSRQRAAVVRGATEQEPQAMKVPTDPAPEPEGEGDGEDEGPPQPPALTRGERTTLIALAALDASRLASAAAVGEAMPATERLSDRTIRSAINKLVKLDLAERPEGDRQGARLTIRGRRLASQIGG